MSTDDAAEIRVGTAGWSVPKAHAAAFPDEGSHLSRYGAVFNAVEINSSFYRPHRRATYERWAATVGDHFRFAVKVPRAITHDARLEGCDALVGAFLEETAGLGARRGPLLVQLPPSLPFRPGMADRFLADLAGRADAPIVCEPRHRSWFDDRVEALLQSLRIARVAADPPPVPGADAPGGWPGLVYLRLHGSPRIYYSAYDEAFLGRVSESLLARRAEGATAWCILDNTAAFAATADALSVRAMVSARRSGDR
ncbi:DUF72 domain-containing protein [Chthonobacter rhizosphaerae]|uniref:DUF72 domain-containing protein n=1 Tax=Chthonobacter rhizosphaerae TaxID=2735553 RepID=UPI0015EF3F84